MPDFSEPHVWGNGFNRSVCETCPHRESNGITEVCGLCGCPLATMNLANAPPESCPRLREHANPNPR